MYLCTSYSIHAIVDFSAFYLISVVKAIKGLNVFLFNYIFYLFPNLFRTVFFLYY